MPRRSVRSSAIHSPVIWLNLRLKEHTSKLEALLPRRASRLQTHRFHLQAGVFPVRSMAGSFSIPLRVRARQKKSSAPNSSTPKEFPYGYQFHKDARYSPLWPASSRVGHRRLCCGGIDGEVVPCSQRRADQEQSLGVRRSGLYRGKTITLIIGASVGGSADMQVRVQLPYIAKFLGANVVPEDISGSNGIQGMDAMAHAVANGLTIGTLNLATGYAFQIEKQTGFNFNPARLEWISENASTTTQRGTSSLRTVILRAPASRQ